MARPPKKDVQVDAKGKKGIVYDDYDEDGRGRRKRAKPTPPNPAVDIIVNAENHSSRNKALEEALVELIPSEPDFVGFQGDLDALEHNLPDEPDDPSANKKVRLLKHCFVQALTFLYYNPISRRRTSY